MMVEMSAPTISVISIALNARDELARTIASVREQAHQPLEYIIVDGGSADGTRELISQNRDIISAFVSEPDRGISDAFNKGARLSRGTWVNFMNAGDIFAARDSLSVALSHARDDVNLIYGQCQFADPDGRVLRGYAGAPFAQRRLRAKMFIPHQATFMHRALFERFGEFALDYRAAMDYDFLLRARDALRPIYVPQPLAIMRTGGASQVNEARTYGEYRRAQVHNGISPIEAAIYYHSFMLKRTAREILHKLGLRAMLSKLRPIDA